MIFLAPCFRDCLCFALYWCMEACLVVVESEQRDQFWKLRDRVFLVYTRSAAASLSRCQRNQN